jgi:DNA-binding CsgD family transcriptional regulator
LAAELGMSGSFGRSMSVNASEDLLRLGRWDEAARRLAATGRLELRFAAELLHHCVTGQLAVARGDFETAPAELARAREMCREETSSDYVIGVHAGWAELALWQGRPQDARREVAEALAVVGEFEDPLYTPVICSLGVRAEADLAAGAGGAAGADGVAPRARAAELAERLNRIIARHSLRVAPVEAVAHQALCEAERSRLDGRSSPEAWAAAAERWEALEQPYPAAYARWREAEALVAAHRRPEAAAPLQRALAAAEGLGARPLAGAVEVLGRAARLPARAGAAPEPSAPSPAARLGLTPREIEILSLVAEGSTNRQIAERLVISERTVGVHVSHILAKLDAPNRVTAAATANRLRLLEAPSADVG